MNNKNAMYEHKFDNQYVYLITHQTQRIPQHKLITLIYLLLVLPELQL
jgi:hypothetical protein